MKLQSDFALLDVKRGRGTLRKALKEGRTIGIVLGGTIKYVHGNDDGVSQEFVVDVTSLEVLP